MGRVVVGCQRERDLERGVGLGVPSQRLQGDAPAGMQRRRPLRRRVRGPGRNPQGPSGYCFSSTRAKPRFTWAATKPGSRSSAAV